MSKKLHIVTNRDPGKDYILFLDTSSDNFPHISYRLTRTEIIDGVETEVHLIESVIEGDTLDRPIHCSELFRILLSMNPGTKFTISRYDSDLYYQLPYDRSSDSVLPKSFIPTITSKPERSEVDVFSSSSGPDTMIEDVGIIKVCDSNYWNLNEEDKDEAEDLINSLLEELDNTEIRCFSPFASSVRNNTRVLELVNDTTYTDTVNFNELLEKVVDVNISCLAEVSVSYTKFGSIYTGSFMFKPFKYISDDSSVDIPCMIEKVGEVQAEYIGGILRVIPLSSQIDECIIDSCTVTYGNI